MENLLRWGFFLIGAFIVFLIFYDVWFRRGNRFSLKQEVSPGNTLSSKNTLHEPFFESNIDHSLIESNRAFGHTASNIHSGSSNIDSRYVEPNADQYTESDTNNIKTRSNFSEDSDLGNENEDFLPPVKLTPLRVPPMTASAEEDIIIISVLAKPPEQFASYDLLQSISATGMQYGAMDIFHYYYPTDQGYITLFSLASATKPGKFDLDHMGDFSCLGLTLFMNKKAVHNPKQAFLIMLEKAQQLADDLNGELRAGPERIPWSDEVEENYLRVFDNSPMVSKGNI